TGAGPATEEAGRVRVVPGVARLVVENQLLDAVKVAPGAKRLLSRTRQDHERDRRVVGPREEFVVQHLAHGQGQTIERARTVQRGHPDLQAACAHDLEKHNIRIILHHLMSTPLSIIWRAMMTRMISLVPSRIW